MNRPYTPREYRRDAIAARFLAQNSQNVGVKFLYLTRLGVMAQIAVVAWLGTVVLTADDISLIYKLLFSAFLCWFLPAFANFTARVFDLGHKLIMAGKLTLH